MKKNLLLFLSAILFKSAFTQIAGPNSGSTTSNVVIAGSSGSWSNTGNAIASDNVRATFTLPNGVGNFTDYIQITNFGFSIPPAATIDGILVEIERSDPNVRTADNRIRIVKNGVIGAQEKSSGAGYANTDSYQTFGNSGDLWGETWTDADINSPNFGVAISARRTTNGTINGRIDHVRITVYYNFVILPLKLLSFDGKQKGKSVELSWSTTDESNMSHFEIERSTNARDFEKLGTLPINNSSSLNYYSFEDGAPVKGNQFYRLKITERTGKVTYSSFAKINFRSDKLISFYPNPVQSNTAIFITNTDGEQINIQFYNTTGKLIASGITSSNKVPAQMIMGLKGMVYYRVSNKNGDVVGLGSFIVQ
jgi:hypothetical protein